MAVRKETMKEQFSQAVHEHLEPGEQLVAGAFAAAGPNPMLVGGLLGIIGMLVAGVRYYFVWVTETRVLFMNASFATARPRGLAWADARAAVSISDVTAASTWSWFRYARPASKPLRLNFARPWRNEFAQIAAALGGGASPAAGSSAPPA